MTNDRPFDPSMGLRTGCAQDRPFVTLNVAMTADGKTDTVARRGATISSPHDLARVDRLRAACAAIMAKATRCWSAAELSWVTIPDSP